MFIGSVLLNNLILHHPFLLLSSIFPSIRVFSNESALHIKWPKHQSFSFKSVLPMNIQDWFPLGLTSLISLVSNRLSRAFSSTTVQKHQFFGVLPYMTTGKTIALTIWSFDGKVMSLLFNILSRFVIAFLPRSNHLLISWQQSPSAIILEPKKRKSSTFLSLLPPLPLLSAM